MEAVMFIGREEELKFLEERYQKGDGQLIVLYGRRRIGKTEILRKFCEDKAHVFYSCTECPDAQQLTQFSERVLTKDMPASKYIQRFNDWIQALSSVAELPGTGKKLLVIDEFPYMVKNNTAIPSILQNLWDETLKNKNIMIILCGSAMSFIEKDILAEKNPLYGRATGILKMNEMSFFDAVQFVPNYSPEEKITTYAVLGGIPHYLKQFSDKKSIEENIVENILARGSTLYSEVEFLIRQELRETSTYNVIIEAIALGNTKLNDIFLKTQIEKSKLSAYLNNLIELGIIRREFSVEDGIKDYANIQRGLYQITDKFFRFWYAYVFPNYSELESGDAVGIWKYVVSKELDVYTSHVFEDVCIEYLRRQNREEKLPFHFTQIGRWWTKTDELDVMALDHTKKNYLLGECKYKNSKFALSDFTHMKEKFKPKGKELSLFYYLFSKNGFTEDVIAQSEKEKIKLITPMDLVQ